MHPHPQESGSFATKNKKRGIRWQQEMSGDGMGEKENERSKAAVAAQNVRKSNISKSNVIDSHRRLGLLAVVIYTITNSKL